MAEDITLQTLSDNLEITNTQVASLVDQLESINSQLATHDTDINDLQNPPVGVPIPLIKWYEDGHTTKEVDTILATDLNGLTSSVSTVENDIEELQIGLSNETASRITADDDHTFVTDDLQTQIDTTNTVLNQEIADRAAMGTASATAIDSTNDRVDDLASDLTTEVTTRSTQTGSLTTQVATLNSAMSVAQQQIVLLSGAGVDPEGAMASQILNLTTVATDASADVAAEETARIAADDSLEASIDSQATQLSYVSSSLDTEVNNRTSKDVEHDAEIATIETDVLALQGGLTAETAIREADDEVLQGQIDTFSAQISDNTSAIINEEAARIDADTAMEADIAANTSNISINTDDIDVLQTSILEIQGKYGVTIDGFGYVTGYQDLDAVQPISKFYLRDLNNDFRLQAPGYTGQYFPSVAVASFAPATSYDTQYGTAPAALFHGTDNADYTRNVLVYATASVGMTGSVFRGVNHSAGGDKQRLGQVLTTFKVSFSGAVNRYLSLWYRIKDLPSDTAQRWYPVAMADSTMPGARTYERVSKEAVVQISVASDKVIEFGLTVLNTLDASIASSSYVFIYGGTVSVEAFNLVTVV